MNYSKLHIYNNYCAIGIVGHGVTTFLVVKDVILFTIHD